MARTTLFACLLTVAAALQAPVTKVAPIAKAVAPKFDVMPIAAAVAPLAVAAPAEAFTGNIAGIPINLLIVGAAPAAALLVALTVIGTGALQQLGRVLSGESKGYFGEN